MQPIVMLVGLTCWERMLFQQRHAPAMSLTKPYALIKLPNVCAPAIWTDPCCSKSASFLDKRDVLFTRTHASTTDDMRTSSMGSSMPPVKSRVR